MKLLAAIVLLAMALGLAWTFRPGAGPSGPVPQPPPPRVDGPGGESIGDLQDPGETGPDRMPGAPGARARAGTADADTPGAPHPPAILLTVVDGDHEPIPGASVRTFDDSVAGSFVTDEAGECRLPVAPAGPSLRLEIEAAGYFHVRAYYMREEQLVIRMSRAVAMTGRVLDCETDAAIADAKVELAHAYCKHCEPERTTTDEVGAYRLKGVPVGENAYFAVSAPGFPTDAFSFALPDDAVDGFEHDFRLQRGILVDGQVVDFLTGAPVPGAAIRDAGRGVLMATTDAAGRFSARFLPSGYDGEIEIGVAEPEHCQARIAFDPRELEGGGPFPLRLPRGANIEGIVRDARGAPVAGARVRVREDIAWSALSRARGDVEPSPLDELPSGLRLTPAGFATDVLTDAEGRFWTGGFVPWTPRFLLDAEHPGTGARRVAVGPVGGPGETTWVEIALESQPEAGRIHGRLLLNGAPVGGTVAWRGANRSGAQAVRDDGEYRLSDVEAGEVWLSASPRRRRDLDFGQLFRGRPERVRVVPGEELEHDLALELHTTTISGRVVGSGGGLAPPPDVVAVAAGSRCRAFATCDEAGAYSLEVPDDEDLYSLVVTVGDLSRSRHGVRAGATGVDFAFPALGRVRYRVVDARTGDRIENCDVAWSQPDTTDGEWHDLGDEHWRSRSPDGWIELELPVGLVALRASNDPRGYLPGTVDGVRVTGPNEGPEVTIELEPGLALELALADGQGPPPDDHRVYLLEEHAWEGVKIERTENGWQCDCGDGYAEAACLRRLVHFEGGRAELKGLPPGAYRFKAFPPGLHFEPERLEVTGEETKPFLVRWTSE